MTHCLQPTGQGVANPLATILSAAMMVRHSFNLEPEAKAMEKAVEAVLEEVFGVLVLCMVEAFGAGRVAQRPFSVSTGEGVWWLIEDVLRAGPMELTVHGLGVHSACRPGRLSRRPNVQSNPSPPLVEAPQLNLSPRHFAPPLMTQTYHGEVREGNNKYLLNGEIQKRCVEYRSHCSTW